MTTLFWQELVLIILAVLLGMAIGFYLRRYWATRSQPMSQSSKSEASNVTSGVEGTAEKAAQAEAEAQRLVEETNARLAEAEPGKAEKENVEEQEIDTETAVAVDESKDGAEAAPETEKMADQEVEVAASEEAVASGLEAEAKPTTTGDIPEQDIDGAPHKIDDTDVNADGVVDDEETRIAAAIAALPDDASNEDKANLSGIRPPLLDGPHDGMADDLKQIKGVGKVIEGKLNNLGVYHYDQVANWSRDEVNWVTTFLNFKGRIDREDWIAQARGLTGKAEDENAGESIETETPVVDQDNDEAKETLAGSSKPEEVAIKDLNTDGDLEAEEARIAAAIAELPKDASMEDKANVAGTKPTLLDAPRKSKADDLKRIKGIGKVIEGKLNKLGVYHFDQVANWSRDEVNWVTTFLSFKGRVDRENWIEQAQKLAAGQETEFSRRVDKGDVESSRS